MTLLCNSWFVSESSRLKLISWWLIISQVAFILLNIISVPGLKPKIPEWYMNGREKKIAF